MNISTRRWAYRSTLLAAACTLFIACSGSSADNSTPTSTIAATDTPSPTPTGSSGVDPTATSPVQAPVGTFASSDLPGSSGRLFGSHSPFNQPISTGAPLHPDSDALVAALAERTPEGIAISVGQWTVAAFAADGTTSTYNVRLTADWAPFAVLNDVPIPDEARPDPEDDGHMAVIDWDAGYVYDFWQAAKTSNGWEASWANRTPLDGDGIYPNGLSARGSGFSLLAGLIWPAELVGGSIDHALVFTYKPNRANVLVAPATETDGASDDPLTLPEGARLQLNPDLDLSSLDLTPAEETIARALQQYGMILGDTGGTPVVELEVVHPYSFGLESFGDVGLEVEEGFAYLWKIPLDEFRVIDYQEVDAESLEIGVADESIYSQ